MNCISTCAPVAHDNDSCSFSEALDKYLAARKHLNHIPEGETVEGMERAEAAYFAAEDALMREPARSISDLAVKIDVCWLDPAAIPSDTYTLALFSDLRRLTAEKSELFNPADWLDWYQRRGGMWCVRGGEVFLLQPTGAGLQEAMYALEASGGREAVCQLILSRTAQEASDGHD